MSEPSDTQITVIPPLSADEDSFALAIIEYGGNLGAAYRAIFGEDVSRPVFKAQALVTKPAVALRIKEISEAIGENALISLGSHLLQLADLRDQSAKTGDMRTALAAEVKRGEVAGYYKDKLPQDNNRPSVTININGQTAGSMEQWAQQHGKPAVIIDMPT